MKDENLGISFEEGVKDTSISEEVTQSISSMPRLPEMKAIVPTEVNRNAPGFFSTMAHSFLETNDIVNLGKGLIDNFQHHDEQESDDWHSIEGKEELYKTIPWKYWSHLADAKSDKEQQRIIEWATKQQQEDELYADGSLTASIIGGLVGTFTSPSSFIALAQTSKFIGLGKNVLQNTLTMTPTIGVSSLMHEKALQIGHYKDDFAELALDTAKDMVYGSALMIAGKGLSHGFNKYKLHKANVALNINEKGGVIKPNIDGDVFNGSYSVVAAEGSSVSAAELDKWTEVVNHSLVKSGMFALPVLGHYFTKMNPTVRGLSHSFESVRMYTNKLADHSLNVLGIKKGIAAGPNAERLLYALRRRSKLMDYQIKGEWLKSIGIEGKNQGQAALYKMFKQKMNSDGYRSLADFSKEVHGVVIHPESPSLVKEVNSIADTIRNHLDETWNAFRETHGLPKDYLPPATAREYLMRIYDLNNISQNQTLFLEKITDELSSQDERITNLKAPLIDAKDRLETFVDIKKQPNSDQKKWARKIALQKKRIKSIEDNLEIELRDNNDHILLLDNKSRLRSEDIKTIEQISVPLKKAKQDERKAAKIISTLKKQKRESIEKFKKSKDADANKVHAAEMYKLDADILEAEHTLEVLEQSAIDAEINIVSDPNIDPRYVIHNNETGQKRLVDISKDKPTLRNPYNSYDERLQAAKGHMSTITGNTPEQISNRILTQMVPHLASNHLKPRVLMLPDKIFHTDNFLSSDLSKMIASYDLSIGKHIIMKQVFPEFGFDSAIDGMSKLISEEKDLKRAAVLSANTTEIDSKLKDLYKLRASLKPGKDFKSKFNKISKEIDTEELAKESLIKKFDPTKDEVKKALAKIDKESESAIKFVGQMNDIFMGNSSDTLVTKSMASILRDYAVTTMLGAVPLTQVADLGGLILKNGIWPFITDGLFPLLKSAATLFKGKQAKEWKRDAADAHLAMEHILHSRMDQLSNPNAFEFSHGLGTTTAVFKRTAEVSGNIFGTTYIDNWLQRISAHMTQSKIMRFMFRHKKGTLNPRDKETLLRNGIDPDKWADKFINNYNLAGGEKSGMGAYSSKWWDWSDNAAKSMMYDAINKVAGDTILKRGLFDNPFFTKSPILNTLLLFKGWVFSATTRYTLPLMQRPQAQDAISLLFALGAGSLVDPFRRLARGEPMNYNKDGAFLSALSNSGALGYIFDAFETANAFTGGAMAKGINKLTGGNFYASNDRYKERSILGIIAGPVGSMADSIQKIASAVANGEMNEKDAHRAIKMIPFTQAWYLRYLTKKIAEGFGLEKTRGKARGMSMLSKPLVE